MDFLERTRTPKRNTNLPRNSSTKLRSLSNRIDNIQRELNPGITCKERSATTLLTATSNPPAIPVHRKYTILTGSAGATGVVEITDDDFVGMQYGAKILDFRVRNLKGRTLRVRGQGVSLLDGNYVATDVNAFDRFTAAPFSRFPTLSFNIPDLLANGNLFTATSKNKLFDVIGDVGDVFEIKIHVLVMTK